LIPNLCTSDCAVVIYASILDQPATYSLAIGSGATEKHQLGVDTNNFGLGLGISNGNIEEEYHGKYVDLFSHPVEFATNLHKNSAAYCGCPPLEMAVDYNLPDYSRSG
jgi:hypothetical protein